jgi:hypothetical protein
MNKKEITLNNNFSFKLKLVVLSIFLILILNSAIFLIDELLLSSRFQILIEKKINSPYSPSSIFGYIYRIIGNSTNLLFRNPFITENNEINLLSITYFFSGLIFLYSILDSILKFFICENFLRHYLFLSSIALLNLTPYIQPRYFIPLILLYIAFNRENTFENLVIWLIIIMISALCVTTQIILGIYPTI